MTGRRKCVTFWTWSQIDLKASNSGWYSSWLQKTITGRQLDKTCHFCKCSANRIIRWERTIINWVYLYTGVQRRIPLLEELMINFLSSCAVTGSLVYIFTLFVIIFHAIIQSKFNQFKNDSHFSIHTNYTLHNCQK